MMIAPTISNKARLHTDVMIYKSYGCIFKN